MVASTIVRGVTATGRVVGRAGSKAATGVAHGGARAAAVAERLAGRAARRGAGHAARGAARRTGIGPPGGAARVARSPGRAGSGRAGPGHRGQRQPGSERSPGNRRLLRRLAGEGGGGGAAPAPAGAWAGTAGSGRRGPEDREEGRSGDVVGDAGSATGRALRSFGRRRRRRMAWRALRGPRYGPLKKTRRRVRWTVVLLVVIVFVLPFCSQLGEAADEGERSGVFVALNAGASGLGSGDIGTIPADAGIPYAGLFNATASLGIDPRLVAAVAWAESGFDPNAVSGDGAMGIMQVMPGTATELGLADPFDPAQAIPAGARYLIRQHERFGSWELALAAYNAGPEAVVQAGGIPDIAETQAYVPKVMGKWEEYRQRFASDVPGGCPMAPRGGTDPLPEVEDSMNTPATQAMARAVFACFGHPHAVYCHDPRTGNGGLYEHPRGRACDFMATSGSSASGEEQVWGQALAEWVAAHAEQLHVLYVIWYRKYWEPADGVRPWEEWSTYTNCGSCTTPTGAHTNHVHVSIQLMPGDPESARCKPGISCR